MLKSSTKVFMTPKSLTTAEMTNTTRNLSSEVTVKTSLLSRVSHPWITISIGLIAVAGILGTVGIAVVSFAVLRSTTLSTITTTTTSTTSTTTPTMCFILPSSRPSNVWLTVDRMSTARIYHTSTLISQDNSVLIAGGYNGAALSSVEKYIPLTGCFQSMRSMPRIRYQHTADQLSSLGGYVLIAGGYGIGGALDRADFFHTITGGIVNITLSIPRYAHTSNILNSSQLVMIGGASTGTVQSDSGDMLNTGLNSLFVNVSNTMSSVSIYHTATLLGNTPNIILVTGRQQNTVYLLSAPLYHGPSNSFIPLGSGIVMPTSHAFHTATYLPPPTRKVLIVGGRDTWTIFDTMLLFDVATLMFTTLHTTLTTARYRHRATLLPNGKVLTVGGNNPAGVLTTYDIVDPFNNYSVASAANLTTQRYGHTATFILDSHNGTTLVCGGYSIATTIINSYELYFV